MAGSFLQRSAFSGLDGGSGISAVMATPAHDGAPASRSPAPEASAGGELDRVSRAASGEPEAQAWLLEQVVPRVRRVARAFLKSPADADDAAQLALLAILRSASTYRGEASLSAWARRIAVRTVLRYLETERRTPSAPSANEAEEPAIPAAEGSWEALPRDVREYLEELPEAQRHAVILHHALGHSVDEIAAATQVSPDTVKGRLKLGTAALRKRIRQEIAIGRRRQS
jgi:RNA polymerase sigma-70 factor (ECF subfamily)